jgi:hypothetical protein
MRGRALGIWGAGLALAGIVMMGLAAAKLNALPEVLQYAALAPAQAADAQKPVGDSDGEDAGRDQELKGSGKAASPLLGAMEKISDDSASLSEAVALVDLSGEAGEVQVAAGNVSEKASLTAAGAHYFDLYFYQTVSGRQFYPEELQRDAEVAVLSDGLAFKLFGSVHAERKSVRVGKKEYFVVGVVREDRQAGRPGLSRLYIPLKQAAEDGLVLETLTLSGRPIPGKGASAAFRDIAFRWLPGGNFLSAERERTYALIPARFCVFLVGLLTLWALGRWTAGWSSGAVRSFREDLMFRYPGEIAWGFAGRMFVSLLSFSALVAAAFLLIGFMLEPVKVFTEWVPTNLVDWNEVSGAFWNAQAASSGLVEVRTPLALRARFFGGMANMGAIFFFAGAALFHIGRCTSDSSRTRERLDQSR